MNILLQLFQTIVRLFVVAISNLSDLIELVARFFSSPFVNTDDEYLAEDRPDQPPQRTRIGWFTNGLGVSLFAPLKLIWWSLISPILILQGTDDERIQNLMAGLPALLVFSVAVFFLLRSSAMSDTNGEIYRVRAVECLRQQEFSKANTYYSRLVLGNNLAATETDKLNWVQTLYHTGNHRRAGAILDELAPNDRQGLESAHLFKAMQMVKSISVQKQSAQFLEQLKFHLSRCGDSESKNANEAWALYYVSTGQLEAAIGHLKKAAKQNVAHYLTITDLSRRMGDSVAEQENLNLAIDALENELAADPLNHEIRIQLASAHVRRRAFEKAGQILVAGFQLKPDQRIRTSLADFYASRYDQQPELEFSKRIEFLSRSLGYDVNYRPTYDRLISCCVGSESTQEIETIRKLLIESLAKGNAPALCHFALSFVYWQDGQKETAQWHIEKAFQLNGELLSIANNLAWILAHSDQPDTGRAVELARFVVSREPDDYRFRDTLATVLMLNNDFDEAAVEFEKVLPLTSDRNNVHRKLAKIYRQLGQLQIAEQHDKLAQSENLEQ